MPPGKNVIDPPVTEATVREFTEALRDNTVHTIKLRAEIKRQREVEEKNIAFLQELVKELVAKKMDSEMTAEKGRWDVAKIVVNYVFKVGGVILLAYVAFRLGLPVV